MPPQKRRQNADPSAASIHLRERRLQAVVYKSLERIATGRLTEVSVGVAHHQGGFKRLCAFKRVLDSARRREIVEDLQREATLGQRMQHPNIVQIIGFAPVEGRDALIMEYVAGADLARLVRRCRSAKLGLSQPMVAAIGTEIARALQYLHTLHTRTAGLATQIAHGRLLPDNVLLSFEGEVKLADFGIASGGADGSPHADLVALGSLMRELLTKGETIDAELEAILVKLALHDPSMGFATAGECELELQTHLNRKHPSYTRQRLSTFLKNLLAKDLKALAPILAQGMNDSSVTFTTPPPAPAQPIVIHVPQRSEDGPRVHRGRELELGGGPSPSVAASAVQPSAPVSQPQPQRVSSLSRAPMGSASRVIVRRNDFGRSSSPMKPLVALALVIAVAVGLWLMSHKSQQAAADGKPTKTERGSPK